MSLGTLSILTQCLNVPIDQGNSENQEQHEQDIQTKSPQKYCSNHEPTERKQKKKPAHRQTEESTKSRDNDSKSHL